MDALVGGVIDVRAVLVDEYACLVLEVVRIARDVVPPLEDGDLVATCLREPARADRTRIACTDNDGIVGQGIEAFGQTVRDAHVDDSSDVGGTTDGTTGRIPRAILPRAHIMGPVSHKRPRTAQCHGIRGGSFTTSRGEDT
ncbi:hypothetical protein HMPREF1316_0194 [Olsenella profusa F0195]|uniref:Uncharacterized protein n=1 Tax=Olsenella profusa F0195 TaxID=1125712 RepID=U2UYN1_9ACTN|nr:hypothetical protein HMPREF1316_0194 [Olsenella profusa F0195]